MGALDDDNGVALFAEYTYIELDITSADPIGEDLEFVSGGIGVSF